MGTSQGLLGIICFEVAKPFFKFFLRFGMKKKFNMLQILH
jgi:hypothetical protein